MFFLAVPSSFTLVTDPFVLLTSPRLSLSSLETTFQSLVPVFKYNFFPSNTVVLHFLPLLSLTRTVPALATQVLSPSCEHGPFNLTPPSSCGLELVIHFLERRYLVHPPPFFPSPSPDEKFPFSTLFLCFKRLSNSFAAESSTCFFFFSFFSLLLSVEPLPLKSSPPPFRFWTMRVPPPCLPRSTNDC